MTSEKQVQKYHIDDVSLPRSGSCFWLVVLGDKFKQSTQKLENEDPKNSKTKTPKLETALSFINWLESLLLIQQESSTITNQMQFKSTQVELWGVVNAFLPLRGRLCFGSDQKTKNAQTNSRMLLYGQEKPIRHQSSKTNNKINTGYPI